MLEEEAHRNFAFTAFHAAETPKLRVNDVVVADLGGGLWQVDVEIANDRLIPTRTARAAQGGRSGQMPQAGDFGVQIVAPRSITAWA